MEQLLKDVIDGPKQHLLTANEPIVVADEAEEDLIDREKMNSLVDQIEREQRIEDNRQESECTLQKLLDQPYVPPCMFYEKKTVLPKETHFIQKAHKLSMQSNKQNSFAQ